MKEWIASLKLDEINVLSASVRVLLAMLSSGIVGIERTKKRRPAGLRTYMLVCVGSCVVMMTGMYIATLYGSVDPSRMAAQVVSGIGFIGAGTIMLTRYKRVKGLTTAAGLWASACMGIAFGAGFYLGAIITLVALFVIMIFADAFEKWFTLRVRVMYLYAVLEDMSAMKRFITKMKDNGVGISEIETNASDSANGVSVFFTARMPEKWSHEQMVIFVEQTDGVLFAEEIAN